MDIVWELLTRPNSKSSDVKTKIRFLLWLQPSYRKGSNDKKIKILPSFLKLSLLTSFKVSCILFGMAEIVAFS